MRYLLLICLLLLIDHAACAQSYDVRKVRWGMTKAQVMNSETGKPYANKTDVLHYLVKVGRYDAGITYKFQSGVLVRAAYIIGNSHVEPQLYITDYEDISDILSRKYGLPSNAQKAWRNRLYEQDPSSYGMAVVMGHLSIHTYWDAARTRIVNMLSGDNLNAKNLIVYLSKLHEQLPDQSTEEGF